MNFKNMINLINSLLIFYFAVGCSIAADVSTRRVDPTVLILGLEIDELHANEKTINWNCESKLTCTYRWIFSSSSSFIFHDEPFDSVSSYHVDANVPEGEYYLYAQAQEADGAVSRQYQIKIIVDHTPATLTATMPSYVNLAQASSAVISGTCNESSKVYIDEVKNHGSACASAPCAGAVPVTCDQGVWSRTYDVNSLTDGAYDISYYSEDLAGNISTVQTEQFDKDTVRPSVTVDLPLTNGGIVNSLNMAAFAVSGTCSEENQTISISGGTVASAICTSGAWLTLLDLSINPAGVIDLRINSVDLAGNPMIEEQVTLTKNAAIIDGTISINGNATITNSTSVSLTITSAAASWVSLQNKCTKLGRNEFADCLDTCSKQCFKLGINII